MLTHPSTDSPNPVTSISLFFIVQKWGYLHKGNLYPAFRQIRGGQRTLPASVESQLSLVQSNLHAYTSLWMTDTCPGRAGP